MATKTANVTRAALGRAAKIGTLYDIRTESFQNDTLFASELDDEMIDILDLGETAIEFVTSDSLEEKCHMLDVEAGLKVSLMTGMIKLNGSGSYLAEERKSARAQSMSLIYKLRTVNEEVLIRQNKNKIDLDVLTGPTTNATHVVVAIDWGAICSITCEYENFENKDWDCTEIKASLKAEIEMLKGLVDVQGSAKVTYEEREKKQHKKFTFKCKTDVSAPDSDLPVAFEGAVELARNLLSLVKKTNGGKGVPLTYYLMPLEEVNNMCNSRKTINVLYREINAGTVKKCADVLARVTQKRQELYDIHHDMHANAAFVPDQSIEATDDIFEEEIVGESRFRAELQQLITSVRSGSSDVCELEKFLGEHEPEKISSQHCAAVSGFQEDLNEVRMIKSWRAKGIRYLGKKDTLTLDEKPHVVVLYKMTRSNDTSNLDKNQDFFLRLQATHAAEDGYQFIIVDRELSEQYWPSGVTNPVIHKYHEGLLVCEDLYVKEGEDMEMCLIEPAQPVYCQFRTKNRAYVCLRCPNAVAGSGLCTGDPVSWRCSKCKDLVEYGIDTGKFYCRCGESVPVESRFRCNDKNHSMMFVGCPSDILNAELSQHRAIKEFNILILGETGVGKSTWINSFQNYLYFDDLFEAMNSPEFHVLIPSSFTFIQDGKAKLIQIGEQDTNEVMETGKPATKEPRSSVFYVGGARIRFIDTPGIGGDSEGIEQDRKNVDNILSYLTYYDEIHAVCILLKPNNARLTAMFRFCIQELLVQLHSSAKDNIVFCFTNTRATFYQPGDTLPTLNKELRDREVGIQATPHNFFCFDNEPFRFLACVKNGVQFSQADIDTYAKSWDRSVEETKRLLEYIKAVLRPHKVRETLSMNEARRIIVAMSKPLAEVARTIDLDVQSVQRTKEQIALADSDIRSLEKNLKFAGYDIEYIKLGYPRIVCTAPSCIEYVQVGTDIVQNPVYKQICQDHCYLEEIPTQTTNNATLLRYPCFGPDGTCRYCGHLYTVHMHLTYDTKVFAKEFLSESVQKEIQKKGSAKTQKEAAKREIDTKITELQEEEKHIMRTAAKYGSFLKANALIPYNDAVGDYLDMCIEQENMKAREFRNTALLSKMQEMKDEYERQRAILDEAIDTGVGENIRTPEQVMELQRELFELKHSGQTFKRLFDGISITNSARNISFGEKIVPVPLKCKEWWKVSKTGSLTDRDNNRPGRSNRYSELDLREEQTKNKQSRKQQTEQLQSEIENQRRLRDENRVLLTNLRYTKNKLTSEEQRIQVLTESLMEKEQSEAAALQLLDEKEKVMARYEIEARTIESLKGIQGATSLDMSDESLEGTQLLSNTSDPSQVSVARDGFDDILKKVAQKVVDNNEIDDLGKALGFTPEDIYRYTAENSMYQHISYTGTLRMLRDWCKTQTNSGKWSALHQTLKQAKFIRLAEEIFGEGKTGNPGEPSEACFALPHSTSSTSADEKTSTSKVRNELSSTDEFAKVLKQLADDLGDDDAQIHSFGGQLGILQHDIKQAIQANKVSSKVPNIGTLGLLKTWREDVSCESERRELRRALISANMVDLARKYFDEGGPSNVKEDTSLNAKDHISGDITPQGEECTDGLTHQSGKAAITVDMADDKPESNQPTERSDKDPDEITVTLKTAENNNTISHNSCCRCQ